MRFFILFYYFGLFDDFNEQVLGEKKNMYNFTSIYEKLL